MKNSKIIKSLSLFVLTMALATSNNNIFASEIYDIQKSTQVVSENRDVSRYSKNTILHINYPLLNDDFLNNALHSQIQNFMNSMNERYQYIQEQETEFKPEFMVDASVGILENHLMFIKFEVETKYITKSENIKSYEMIIYNVDEDRVIEVSEFLKNDYPQRFYSYARDYFYDTYAEIITTSSDNYPDIAPKYENYTKIFMNGEFLEVPIYDYIKKEEILLSIPLGQIAINIRDEYSFDIKEKYLVQELDTEENIILETEVSNIYDTQGLTEVPSEVFTLGSLLENSTNLLLQSMIASSSEVTANVTETTTELHTEILTEFIAEVTTESPIETLTEIITEIPTETTTEQIQVLEVAQETVFKGSGRVIDKNKPMVALTFDDGPSAGVTTQILDILDRYDSVATFFVLGSRIESEATILQRMVDSGNQIENHTFSHKNLTQLSETQILNELELVEQKLLATIGQNATMVRVPYGAINDKVKNTIDYPIISWSVDPRDWESRNSTSVQNAVLSTVKDGDIVLMHDLYKSTSEACEVIIPELINRGYQLVTVEELYYYRDVELQNNKVYSNAYKK